MPGRDGAHGNSGPLRTGRALVAGSLLGGDALTDVAHVIQTALTPVFLLSGIGTLLNVFSTRLARVADQYHRLTELLASNDDLAQTASLRRHIARVSRRRSALDTSVILGGMAGALTCGAAFALFLVTLRSAEDTEILLWLFGGALGCTMAALMAFLVDTALAWHGLRMDGPVPQTAKALDAAQAQR